jgi:hypothetical protein
MRPEWSQWPFGYVIPTEWSKTTCTDDSSKGLVIFFAVTAIIASTSRLLFRYRHEDALRLEDYLVLFATTLLVVETGLVYSFTSRLYIIDAATTHLSVLSYVVKEPELAELLLETGATLVAYFTLGWAAIFAIKFSFLALFYRMLRNVSRKLMIYFWITVAATAISGVVIILESFILCPRFGADAGMCVKVVPNIAVLIYWHSAMLSAGRLYIQYKIRRRSTGAGYRN